MEEAIVGTPATGEEGTPAIVAPVVAAPDAGLTLGDPSKDPVIKTEVDTVGAVTYAATGDAGLDMALTFVGNLGLGPEDAAIVAAGEGNFAMLKAKLAALGDKAKGWEQYVALAEKAHADVSAKTQAQVEKDTKVVHDAVGGKENWNNISKWASENAEPDEKVAVNTALKAGGIAAKAMATYLQGLYSRASGTVVEPASVVAPGAVAKPDAAGALSAAEYSKEVQALRKSKGYNFDKTPEYRTLQARRTAGQRAGK